MGSVVFTFGRQATETSSDAQAEDSQLLTNLTKVNASKGTINHQQFLKGWIQSGLSPSRGGVREFAHRRLLDFPERSFASLEMSGIVAGICKLRSSHFGSCWIDLMPYTSINNIKFGDGIINRTHSFTVILGDGVPLGLKHYLILIV